MITYTQLMFNAINRKNPVNVIWDGSPSLIIYLARAGCSLYNENKEQIIYTGSLDNIVDDSGDEEFATYEEARAWVQKYLIDDKRYEVENWKIVDTITNKIITSNYDDAIIDYQNYLNSAEYDENEPFSLTDWFDYDEEECKLIAEYDKFLEEKRIEEILMNIAISKIRRNAIYNLGLGLKLSMKSYFKGGELIV